MSWEDACAWITSGREGTGYLVSSTQIITCKHLLGGDADAKVRFGRREMSAKVERTDGDLDLALLHLAEPILGVEPLKFASACPADSRWKTYGYPILAGGLPIPMQGYVAKPDGVDSFGQNAVVLYADQVKEQGQSVSGFSGSPVVVNGLVVATIKRILENPDRKGWPLYGLLWATPSTDILSFLGYASTGAVEPEPSGVDSLKGIRHELESAVSATDVYGLWNSLQETGVKDEPLSIRAAKLLVAKGRPELAREIADSLDNTVPARRLRAYVLSEVGDVERAIELLEQLEEAGNMDSNSGGILAGRYRHMWIKSGSQDDAWRRKSADTYMRHWNASGDTYCGINAAAMALHQGKEGECRRTAAQVLCAVEGRLREKRNHWDLATRAEALLLLGDIDSARVAYSEAKGAAAGNDHDIAVMWQCAITDLKALGKPPDLLDDVLRPRAVGAFFGHSVDSPDRKPERFPGRRVRDVRAMLAAKIKEHRIGFGVCSACRGSDLLFLHELVCRHNGRAVVVLTSPREEFVSTFIGPHWQDLFDEVTKSGRVELRVLEPSGDAWQEVRKVVHATVRQRAEALKCDPLLLVVWDGQPSYVGDCVELWETFGDPVDRIPLGEALRAAG